MRSAIALGSLSTVSPAGRPFLARDADRDSERRSWSALNPHRAGDGGAMSKLSIQSALITAVAIAGFAVGRSWPADDRLITSRLSKVPSENV
jgi:hypothetical protein